MQEVIEASHLDEIQAFIVVANHGSFSAAAKVLGRDTSVISRRISSLEGRLGAKLLERNTRKLALTEVGASYLERVRRILAEIVDAAHDAGGTGGGIRGLLRVSLPRTFGRLWVAPHVSDFLAAHPDVRVEARYSDAYMDLIGEGFDVAVRIGTLPDSSLVARKVAATQRVVVASPGYLQRNGRPETPEDLARHRCLTFEAYERPAEWTLQQGADVRVVRVQSVYRSDDASSLLQAAASGAGLVIASDWLVAGLGLRHELEGVLRGWRVGADGGIYIVTPSSRLLPAKTKAFIDFIVPRLQHASKGWSAV